MLLISMLFFQGYESLGAEVSPADRKASVKALRNSEEVTQEKVSAKLLAIVPGWDPINHERLHGSSI
jgi:hypothetical protein